MKLGRILGFEVTLDATWFIIFAMVVHMLASGAYPSALPAATVSPGLALAVLGAVLLFGSVLLHELGHSVVGRRLGVEIEGITLFIFGGVARLKDEPRSARVEFWMTAAGPAVSAFLWLTFLGLGYLGMAWEWPARIVSLFGHLAFVNQMLALFNLIPAFPLDGGRLFRSALWKATRNVVTATKWATGFSRMFAILFVATGALAIVAGHFNGLWTIFIGMFIHTSASAAYRQVVLRSELEGVTVASLMSPSSEPIPGSMTLNWVADRLQTSHAVPVLDGDIVRGILTGEDLARVPEQRWPWTMAIEVCRPLGDETTIDDRENAWQALTRMLGGNARRLLVLRDGRVQGVVTWDQVLHRLRAS